MTTLGILDSLCPAYGPGPLTPYRDSATFCWRQLKVKFHTEEGLELKLKLWKLMEQDPLFAHSPVTIPLDTFRDLTFRRVKRLNEWNIPYTTSVTAGLSYISAGGMYNWSLMARKMLLSDFIVSNILGSGTKHHHKTLLEPFRKGQYSGCFCLTEMSHGSNSKGVRTTATFIKESNQFEINTPDFEAAKTWSGNLGETATHASVFAQLYTVDEKTGNKLCHGLHNLIIPIRDPASLETYPGLVIGDLGEKLGLNGVDNGFMIFDNFRVPRESLLDATGGIDEQGNYVTPFRDPSKRFGASLGNLSSGRVGIVTMANANLHLATVIGIRYSAARKQFGAEDGSEELSVIEYQTQQCRLFPYLAASFALHNFAQSLGHDLLSFNLAKMAKEDGDIVAAMGREIHGLSSAGKPLASWTARDAIQEIREACGGHGYLKAGRLGQLRDDNDANCTYEGDNNVLLQQTSNWLIGVWKSCLDGEKILSPFGSLIFLDRKDELLTMDFESILNKSQDCSAILSVLQSLVVHLMKCLHDRVVHHLASGKNDFQARNDTQFFLARDLSIAFIQTTILERYLLHINENNAYDSSEKLVLNELAYLYGLSCTEKLLPHFLHLGIIKSGKFVGHVHKEIIETCKRLKPNAVALADILAPTDFILNSALGHSSGDIYKQLQKSFYSVPGGFEKAKYWQEITEDYRKKSKL